MMNRWPVRKNTGSSKNRFAGTCACGARVVAFEGFRINVAGKWAVRHAGCMDTVKRAAEYYDGAGYTVNTIAGACERCRAWVDTGKGLQVGTDVYDIGCERT